MCGLEKHETRPLCTSTKNRSYTFSSVSRHPSASTRRPKVPAAKSYTFRLSRSGAQGVSCVMCAQCSIRHVLYLEVRASFKLGVTNFSMTQQNTTTEQIICLRKIGPPQGEDHGVRGRRSTVEEKHARRKPLSTVRRKSPNPT